MLIHEPVKIISFLKRNAGFQISEMRGAALYLQVFFSSQIISQQAHLCFYNEVQFLLSVQSGL